MGDGADTGSFRGSKAHDLAAARLSAANGGSETLGGFGESWDEYREHGADSALGELQFRPIVPLDCNSAGHIANWLQVGRNGCRRIF